MTLGSYGIGNNALQEFVFGATGITTIFASDIILNTALNGFVGNAGTSIGGRLSINLSNFSFTGAQTFTLINSSAGLAVGEIFNSVTITGNSGYTANVTYDTLNHDVLLNVVPEPTTFAMLLGGAGLLMLIRRRR